MTPEEQDHAIELLRAMRQAGSPEDELEAMSHQLSGRFMPMVYSAAQVCRAYFARRDPPQEPPADFVQRHYDSWRRYLLNAAAADGGQAELPDALAHGRVLLASWHFPEHPAWLARARAWDWLLVMGRRSARTQSVLGAAHLANFREDGLGLDIARAFHGGRAVCGMFDFCYDDSYAVIDDFLGAPAITAAGLLKLGERFGYKLCIVSGERLEGALIDMCDLAEVGVQAAAARINRAFEAQILADPPRWLLWGAVPQRWDAAARRLGLPAPETRTGG